MRRALRTTSALTEHWSGHQATEADHALRLHVPDLQPQASEDVRRVQRGHPWRLQLRDFAISTPEAVERDARIQVMDVMVADIGGEPSHDLSSDHEAGGFECGLIVSPPGLVGKADGGEIMLRVEEIRSNGIEDEVRKRLCEQQSLPSPEISESHAGHRMHQQGDKPVAVLSRFAQERRKAHPEEEHEDIAEENRQGVPHEEILQPGPRRRIEKLLLRHDRKGTDVRTAEL